jgi:hypothetical protein
MVLPIVIAVIAIATYFFTQSKSTISEQTKKIDSYQHIDKLKKEIKSKEKKGREELKNKNIKNLTEKEIVKKIKGGSKNFKDWYYNEKNAECYEEIERRNREIEKPKLEKVGKVFRDDPNAISLMETKIKNKEKMVLYWKKIIKFPARDYGNNIRSSLGDAKWYALTGASTEVREAKKKLAKLQADKKAGVKLERKPTYTTGKKRFYYKKS